MVACKNDSDCDLSKCQYCTSDGYCKYIRGFFKDNIYSLGHGDGDCNGYSKSCPSNLGCGHDNFLDYHPKLSHCGTMAKYSDVCVEKGICFNSIFVQRFFFQKIV